MRKVITHLSFYVLLAIILGIFLGVYFPTQAIQLEPLAKGFIQVIKIFTYPIIFLTVTLGIASMGDLKKVGRIGLVSLVYFEIVSTISLAIGVLVALWIRPGNIDKSGLQMQDPTKYTKATQFDLWGIIASNTKKSYLYSSDRKVNTFCFTWLKMGDVLCATWCFRRHGLCDWEIWFGYLIPFG